MSLRGIMIGAVGKAVDLRTSKNGKQFATFPIRENVNGATRRWQAIAFGESAIEVLMEKLWDEWRRPGIIVAG
jgi:hypothetical protein